jgi:DNA-binding response OmpR family regulator
MTKCILFCDDDVHIVRAAEFKFRHAGYEVHTAGDGEEALESIRTSRPDLLITDCQMPRLDGLGLIQRLREDPVTANLPVLMLTAKGFELSHDEMAKRWNILAILPKPFSPRELLRRVDGILNLAASTT